MANKNKNKKIESFDQLASAQQHKRPAASQEEPAISTMLDEFEMWMALNWKKAIIGVCAFAVVVSVVIIIQGAIQRAELAARRELANAGSIAELEAAIAKHPGNKAADFARLRLAGELITVNQPGDLEKARELQNYAQEVINVICRFRGNIVGGKRIMKLIGLDLGPNRTPFRTVEPAEEAELRRQLEEIDFFNRCNVF